VHDLGIEKFRELVMEERRSLPPDPRWTEYIADAERTAEEPLRPPGSPPLITSLEFQRWLATNTRLQKQEGYMVVAVALPLGDITAHQLRSLADIVRRYSKEAARTTVEQNFVIRWVSGADLAALYRDLESAGLAQPGAGTIVDITSCPGTDTCKLGISSSRGLAAELRKRLTEKNYQWDESVQNLHIKVSGCFNSCGQHHVADLGFYGVSRKVAGYAVPHFQVVLGGEWERNAGSYGLPFMAVPSKHIPEVVTRLLDRYLAGRNQGETFSGFIKRIGKGAVKRLFEDLTRPPADLGDRSFFRDWNDPREYSLGDLGAGECAGEVVSSADFGLAAAERQVFEAQLALEDGDFRTAWQTAYQSMLQAAKSLIRAEAPVVTDDPDEILREFRTRFYDTQKFFDPFAGGKFAHYLFAAHRNLDALPTPEKARHLIEEAQLFIEASHNCYNRTAKPVSV
jgi:dissimilatory sulfite reductase (desulfoviridin) alpha/beta subunit